MKNYDGLKIYGVIGCLNQKEMRELNISDSIIVQRYLTNVGVLYCVVISKYPLNEYDDYYTKGEIKRFFTNINRKEKLKNIEGAIT